MRKLTLFALLATSAIPAMASAQDEGGRHWRQSNQSEQPDNRPARDERADRPQRDEARAQMQAERQAAQAERQAAQSERQAQIQQQMQARQQQVQDRQVQVQQPVQPVQVDRRGRGQRDGDAGDRQWRGRDDSGQQDGQVGSRDERMQQYRQMIEQRRAQGGVQVAPQDGSSVGRPGRYGGVPRVNPNTAGRPAPENRDARYAHRDDRRDRTNWTNNWRNDRRYDWRDYRNRHRSTFRIGFYFDPFGYSYNRFGIGSYMYPGYYQSNYWINDPWQYRLPPAYGPYRWVRYHNDALLIDTWSGEVVDVIYSFFW